MLKALGKANMGSLYVIRKQEKVSGRQGKEVFSPKDGGVDLGNLQTGEPDGDSR